MGTSCEYFEIGISRGTYFRLLVCIEILIIVHRTRCRRVLSRSALRNKRCTVSETQNHIKQGMNQLTFQSFHFVEHFLVLLG